MTCHCVLDSLEKVQIAAEIVRTFLNENPVYTFVILRSEVDSQGECVYTYQTGERTSQRVEVDSQGECVYTYQTGVRGGFNVKDSHGIWGLHCSLTNPPTVNVWDNKLIVRQTVASGVRVKWIIAPEKPEKETRVQLPFAPEKETGAVSPCSSTK